MSHGTHVHKSWRTYEWVMAHLTGGEDVHWGRCCFAKLWTWPLWGIESLSLHFSLSLARALTPTTPDLSLSPHLPPHLPPALPPYLARALFSFSPVFSLSLSLSRPRFLSSTCWQAHVHRCKKESLGLPHMKKTLFCSLCLSFSLPPSLSCACARTRVRTYVCQKNKNVVSQAHYLVHTHRSQMPRLCSGTSRSRQAASMKAPLSHTCAVNNLTVNVKWSTL